ncbi:hypothetical protein B7463_g732, partial [Scytalidium lignicola]
MKFSTTVSTLFFILPFTALASPVPEGAAPVALEEGDPATSTPISARDLFERSSQTCKIINVSTYVNCRTGPSTSYPAPWIAHEGDSYTFQCYERGECVDGNCTWDKLVWNGGHCFINGAYTDNHCTIARLGAC